MSTREPILSRMIRMKGTKMTTPITKSQTQSQAAPVAPAVRLVSLDVEKCTLLHISRNDNGEFDPELTGKAIKSVVANPFRNVYLRIPQKSADGYLGFTNEQFGGTEGETYAKLFDEILGYTGTTKSFRFPMGFVNVHANFAGYALTKKVKINTEVRTNLNGEAKYLNKQCLLPLATDNENYTETHTQSGTDTVFTSNALFLSKYSVLKADDSKDASSRPSDTRAMSSANKTIIQLLSIMNKTCTSADVNFDSVKEDDTQREIVYVLQLPDCEVSIDPTKSAPNSLARVKVLYAAIQEYLREKNASPTTINNVIREVGGKPRPVGFKYVIFAPSDAKTGGKVCAPTDIPFQRFTINLNLFHDRLFGFGHTKPNNDVIMSTMSEFLKVYGYHLDDPNERRPIQQEQRGQPSGSKAFYQRKQENVPVAERADPELAPGSDAQSGPRVPPGAARDTNSKFQHRGRGRN
jgi:hypothetical protein